ncbi:chemotaxis protein CheW [Caulobacter segnis]|uniref:chemotaxis protein CheW n=1 Tax=Caulobacter segnis TaxID=88688 RepID=UPI0028662257|nr:chemotaxis protein CheW [Caulobacter segnis]MDR6625555.1 purine-binding chemotaxis protein CheW [Caulobacter segnis]
MAAPSRQGLTVWAGGAQMRIDAATVAEVIRLPAMTRAPHAPPCLMSVAHYRGGVLPIISASDLLGRKGRPSERVVVLRGAAAVGLAVEEVGALEVLDEARRQDDGRRILEDEGGGRIDLDEVLLERFVSTARARGQNTGQNASTGWVGQEQSLTRAFLGFRVSGQAFCLPLQAVKEVANVQKEGLTAQALQRDAIERRGEILPLISASALLGLLATTGEKRLVIVGTGGRDFGLVVDRIDAVIRLAEDRIVEAPSLFNRGDAEALIGAVLRMPDGKGVVSVLSLERLVAHVDALATASLPPASSTSATSAASPRRFLVLALGEALYGLPMEAVRQVIRRPARMARPPKAPSNLKGVIRLRGDLLPVINVGGSLAAGGASGASRVVVMSSGQSSTGLLADRIEGVIDVRSRDISPPGADRRIEPLLEGVCEHEGRAISLIDPPALLRSIERDLAREMARGFAAP